MATNAPATKSRTPRFEDVEIDKIVAEGGDEIEELDVATVDGHTALGVAPGSPVGCTRANPRNRQITINSRPIFIAIVSRKIKSTPYLPSSLLNVGGAAHKRGSECCPQTPTSRSLDVHSR